MDVSGGCAAGQRKQAAGPPSLKLTARFTLSYVLPQPARAGRGFFDVRPAQLWLCGAGRFLIDFASLLRLLTNEDVILAAAKAGTHGSPQPKHPDGAS